MDSYVSHAWDALSILVKAIREVGTDGAAIKDYLANMGPYEGVAGTFVFDENGATMKNVYVMQIQNGQFVEMPDVCIEPQV